jgi:SOS response regulatory protein OraA/RecX
MPEGAERAYVAGLTLLARRELAEAQLRERLGRKFDRDEVDAAVIRLRREQALDDRRTALACARTLVRVKHRWGARVVRQIELLGISRSVAREAASEVFAEFDESTLLEQAIDRRLRRGMSLTDSQTFRRVRSYLMGQGFTPDAITAALTRRRKVT